MVFLSCPVNELLRRIRIRGRDAEKSIQRDYLENLSLSINNVNLISNNTRVVRINSNEQDFSNDKSSMKNVLDSILNLVKNTV